MQSIISKKLPNHHDDAAAVPMELSVFWGSFHHFFSIPSNIRKMSLQTRFYAAQMSSINSIFLERGRQQRQV